MFRGPHFILSTMQGGITPIFEVFGMTGQCSELRSKFVHPPGAEGAKCVHPEFNSNAHKLKYTLNIRQCGTHAGCTAFKIVHPASKSC